MTPKAIRIISTLRQEFYSHFAAAMNVPVTISGSSYNSSSLIASWVDDRERLNYVTIYAYAAPDELLDARPFILRVAINKGAGSITFSKQRHSCQGLNQRWHFELTVLPEEVLDFLPWIVNLIKAKAKGVTSFAQEPPHPVNLDVSSLSAFNEVWTQSAERIAELQEY